MIIIKKKKLIKKRTGAIVRQIKLQNFKTMTDQYAINQVVNQNNQLKNNCT